MGVYTSSIGSQLQRFEETVKRIIRGAMLQGARRFRSRMMRERLSGPPGLYKKTGKLRRSLITGGPQGGGTLGVRQGSGHIRYRAQIGGSIAPYAAQHEQAGRLEFRRLFNEEAAKTIDAIRTAMQFVASGTPGFDVAGFVAFSDLESGFDRDASAAESRRRFSTRTSSGRRNIRTGLKQFRKLMKSKKWEQFEASGLAPILKARAERVEGLLERGRQSQLRRRRSRGGRS